MFDRLDGGLVERRHGAQDFCLSDPAIAVNRSPQDNGALDGGWKIIRGQTGIIAKRPDLAYYWGIGRRIWGQLDQGEAPNVSLSSDSIS